MDFMEVVSRVAAEDSMAAAGLVVADPMGVADLGEVDSTGAAADLVAAMAEAEAIVKALSQRPRRDHQVRA